MNRLAVVAVSVALMAGAACERNDEKYAYVKDTSRGRLGWAPRPQGGEIPCVALKPQAGDVAVACPVGNPPRIFAKWVKVGDETAVIGVLAPGLAEVASSGVGVLETTESISNLGGRRLFTQLVDDDLNPSPTLSLAENADQLASDPVVTLSRP